MTAPIKGDVNTAVLGRCRSCCPRERDTLERWARATTARALALRCRIVLACAEDGTNVEIARRLGVDDEAVRKWRGRFATQRPDGEPAGAGLRLEPHLVDSFKLSPDPQFIDKVHDIVGLYLNPPWGGANGYFADRDG